MKKRALLILPFLVLGISACGGSGSSSVAPSSSSSIVPSTTSTSPVSTTSEKLSYTLTWDFAGGTPSGEYTPAGQVKEGTALVAPTVTKTGYTFAGWSPAVPSVMPASNMTFTATWNVNSYNLTWDYDGGTPSGTFTPAGPVAFGSTLVAPTVTKTGYTFVSWSPAVAATMPAEDVTYTAIWNVNSYTLTWDFVGGTPSGEYTQPGSVAFGTALVAPVVTKTGYTFAGWSPIVAATMPAENVTYTATWTVNNYTLTWDFAGGTPEGEYTPAGPVAFGTTLIVPTLTKTNYTFAGWSPEVPASMPAEDVTYTATWTPKTSYTLTWNLDGGEASGQYTPAGQVYDGTPLVAPTVTKENYDFAGWNPGVPALMPSANVTYTATWTPKNYTLTWDFAGGTPSGEYTPAGQVAYGTTLVAPTLTKENYDFTGWSPAVPATMPGENVTYTATWAAKKFNLAWDFDGGVPTGEYTQAGQVGYGTTLVAPTDVVKLGCDFAGFTTEVASTMPAHDVSYKVKWAPITLLTPTKGGEVVAGADYTFSWACGDAENMDCYELFVSTDPSNFPSAGYLVMYDEFEYKLSFANAGTYYWKVVGYSSDSTQISSIVKSFVVVTE